MADGGVSALEKAGSVAAIVGASVAVVLLLAGIARWWWRNHRIRSVAPRIFRSGVEIYLGVSGVPSAFTEVTAFVNDGKDTKRLGPGGHTGGLQEEILFNVREGRQQLDESVNEYTVKLIATSPGGSERRIFKKKIVASWKSS